MVKYIALAIQAATILADVGLKYAIWRGCVFDQ